MSKNKNSKNTNDAGNTAESGGQPLELPTEGGVYKREHPTAPLTRNADGSLFRHDAPDAKAADVATDAASTDAPVRNID